MADEPPAPEAAEEQPQQPEPKKDIYKEIKKVPKPDEAAHKERLAAETEKIQAKQERLEQIKATLEAREGNREQGDSELAIARRKHNEARLESRRLHHEKRSIYDQIFDADKQKKQQQDLTQRLKAELQQLDLGKGRAADITVEDIDRKIKALEHQQQTMSLNVKQDKKIMEDIKRLASKKPVIKQYEEAQESLKEVREHHDNLYAQVKAKMAQQAAMKEEEEKCRVEMEEAKAREEAKRSDLPALFKEREQIRKEINEIRDEQRRIRDEYNEQKKEHQAYLRALREQKQQIWQAQQAERKAEEEKRRKEFEEEEAKRDPWEEEKAICEQLINYVEKWLPKTEDAPAAANEAKPAADVPANMVIRKRDDDDEYLAMIKSKKGKKKGGGGANASAPATKKSMKLSHNPENFAIFAKLGFKAPAETSECPELYKQLLEKREWLKTAPPKKKQVPAPEAAPAVADGEAPAAAEAEAPAAAEGVAPAPAREMRGGLHKFDASEVDVEGGDATADDFLDAFGFDGSAEEVAESKASAAREQKAAPKPEPEAADTEAPAPAKEMRGGLHKFDASEVDVEGGDATADDFLDAFGFDAPSEKGADAEVDTEATPAPAAASAEAPAPAKEMRGGLHKFDASEVDVEGGDATADDFLDAFGFDAPTDSATEAAPAAETPAEAQPAKEMRGGLHKFDASEVDVEGGDATADDFLDAFGFDAPAEKAAETAPAEASATEAPAPAKEMRGGLHKFDASEVDVEGGDATADDFLDAFGFEGGPAPAAPAAGGANGKVPDILQIQATSSSTVRVALDLDARQ